MTTVRTVRERCKHCGRLGEYQVQRTTEGHDALVPLVSRVCPVRSLAPFASARTCEAETRADRIAQSERKRLARKFGKFGARGKIR